MQYLIGFTLLVKKHVTTHTIPAGIIRQQAEIYQKYSARVPRAATRGPGSRGPDTA